MNSFKKVSVLAVGTAALVMTGAGAASASADADAAAVKSSGVFSGNIGQTPFHTPAMGCGDTANTGAALNPAFGNECVIAEINDYGDEDYEHEGHRRQDHPHGGGGYQHDDGHRSLLERVGV